MHAIKAQSIYKKYGEKIVIDDVTLTINNGGIHAILGPNGAGKTTLVHMFATLNVPDSGIVEVMGHDVKKAPEQVRKLTSLVGQSTTIDEDLTSYENLFLIGRLHGLSVKNAKNRADELLIAFDLLDAKNTLLKHFSGGMRRRLDVAASIVCVPPILFLDEPTTGMDPRSRNELHKALKTLSKNGTTIVLTTQYLEEADLLADKISVLDRGKIISEGSSSDLKKMVGNDILHFYLENHDTSEDTLKRIFREDYSRIYMDNSASSIKLPVKSPNEAIVLLNRFNQENIPIKGFNLSQPDINEVFLSLTGKHEIQNSQKKDVRADKNGLHIENLGKGAVSNLKRERPSMFTQSAMFGWRNLLKIVHLPEQFVDIIVTPVAFTFIFTFLFGSALSGSTSNYLQFFIPGVLVQTLTFNIIYSGININVDIRKGIFNRFRSMPIWPLSPFMGLYMGDCIRHVISWCCILVFGIVLGYRINVGVAPVALAFLISVFFAFSVSWILVILGIVLKTHSAVYSIGWLVLLPIVFVSNVYVDPATMPQWVQTLIAFNPLSWQVEVVRALLEGTYLPRETTVALGASVLLNVVLAPVAILLFRKTRQS